MSLGAAVFVLALGAIVYTYAGFPLLVAVMGSVRRRPVARASITPSISLIIAAYNEEDDLGERLDNALDTDYPEDCMEIIVASDGSTDRTVEIARSKGVRVLELPRRGKIPALNDAAAAATGEILVFSDANTLFRRNTIKELIANFADPDVGGVAGNTGYITPTSVESSARGENLYWNYDSWIKAQESLSGSVVSAHGGLYGIRREYFDVAPDPAVTDDFFISTGVVTRHKRLVFEPRATAYEFAVAKADREFSRRVRLMTRGLRSLYMRRELLNPFRHGFYALALFSRKLLRRVIPVLLVVLYVSSIALGATPFFRWAAILQTVFYLVALAGWVLRGTRIGQSKLLYVPFFFCMANLASLIALVRFLRGERIVSWKPQRHAPAGADVR